MHVYTLHISGLEEMHISGLPPLVKDIKTELCCHSTTVGKVQAGILSVVLALTLLQNSLYNYHLTFEFPAIVHARLAESDLQLEKSRSHIKLQGIRSGINHLV